MNILVLFTALALAPQDGETRESFIQDHTRNAAVLACLEAPDRACAIRSALQTAVAEKLPAEQSRILAGVAHGLADIGQMDQAVTAATRALEAAEDSGLSFSVQFRLRDLVPLYARLGDSAGAMALAERVTSRSLRHDIIAESAIALAGAGKPEDAILWLDQLPQPYRAISGKLRVAALVQDTHASLSLKTASDLVVAIETSGSYAERLQVHALMAAHARAAGETETLTAAEGRVNALADLANDNRTHSQAYAWRGWLARYSDQAASDGLLNEALDSGSRLRLVPDKLSFAHVFAPKSRSDVQVSKMLEMVGTIDDPIEKVDFLSAISKAPHGQSEIADATRLVMLSLDEIESAYDRDQVRMRAMSIPLRLKDAALGTDIVKAMEDDDSQARGLALMASLLP